MALEMSFIRSISVLRYTPAYAGLRLFSTTSTAYSMSTRARKPKTKNSFERKKSLESPKYKSRPGKSDKKRNVLDTRSKRKSTKAPEKLGYGEYSALKEIKSSDTKGAENLINKIDSFKALKLLPEVRKTVIENIKRHSVLNSSNYVGPCPNRFEEKFIEKKTTKGNVNTTTIEEHGILEDTVKPSPIQVAAIKIMSQYIMTPELTTYTIAAETGSGKTWAYMAPLLDYLKREEQDAELWDRINDKAIIRSVIMVPTHELVDQIYQSSKDVFESLGLKAFKWDTGSTHKEFVDALKGRIDILITTPGKVNSIQNIRMIANPQYVFTRTRFLAIDEADTLMDRSWIDDTCDSIKRLPNLSNLVFCSATIPQEFNKSMEKLFPTAIPITTPSLHKIPKTIKFSLINADVQPYQGSKIKALAQALYAIHRDSSEAGFEKRCIVFVNEKKDVAKIGKALKDSYNHDVVTLTGEDTAEDRSEKVGIFIKPPRRLKDIELAERAVEEQVRLPDSNIVLTKKSPTAEKEGSLKVLVTTDLLARGLNFSAIRNVILYDVPNTAADLVHRSGRTGRMNQAGRVFLITDKKSKTWVRRLPKIVKEHGLIT